MPGKFLEPIAPDVERALVDLLHAEQAFASAWARSSGRAGSTGLDGIEEAERRFDEAQAAAIQRQPERDAR